MSIEKLSDIVYDKGIHYTSPRYNFGFYYAFIFAKSKTLKRAHSGLCNCFSNAAIGENGQAVIQDCSVAKYRLFALNKTC